MDKLPKCRMCLAENVRMYVVVNKNLHELYEKLTDNPFITEDNRPMLACFFCCTKLKQCCRFQRKCLEAEELFAQMMNKDNEPKPLIYQDHLECFNGFIQSPVVHLSIDDACQTESDDIKVELPAVCEGPDDIIEQKEEYLSDGLELENLNNSHSNIDVRPAPQSESSSVCDLVEIKIEIEEDKEVSLKKRRASDTKQQELEHLNNSYSDIEDMPAQNSESDYEDDLPLKIISEVEEEQEAPKKKRRASDTQQRKPQTKEQRLEKQRLCKRRRYKEINNDPELLAIEKEKRRLRYLKRKEEKRVVLIQDIAPRFQREQRRRWKDNSRNYRQRKKETLNKKVALETSARVA